MVNATEMAKIFDKLPSGFLRVKQTQKFIATLKKRYANLHNENIVRIIQGGDSQGTWMHEKLTLKFAAWLSPEFELWVFDKIQEILKNEYDAFHAAPPQNVTYIYFLKSAHLNRVKIGMSENIHNR